jgi:hypothetical protein
VVTAVAAAPPVQVGEAELGKTFQLLGRARAVPMELKFSVAVGEAFVKLTCPKPCNALIHIQTTTKARIKFFIN